MTTRIINVPDTVGDKLQRLSMEIGKPISETIEELLERYERDRFFEDLAEDFKRLRADPAASAEYDAELVAWDATLLDGLADLPYDERRDEDLDR